MKFTAAFSALVLVLPAFVSAAAVPEPKYARGFGRGGQQSGNGKGGNQNTGANNAGKGAAASSSSVAASSVAVSTTAAAAAATATSTATNSTSSSNSTASNDNGNPQDSLTLDPAVISTGFEQDGQQNATAGQVASLTSSDNFINFCLTTNQPLTNGQQITTGSCNTAPMGSIPSSDNMPSAAFTSPKNLDVIAPNTAFTVSMAIQGMQTGAFVNADTNYFAAPQQLNGAGQIIGHSHIVIEQLSSIDQTTPTNPKIFAFFKGLNAAAVNGILTADVTNGLQEGTYRISSINTAANHQPVLVPIAQHGSLDAQAFFTVSANGAGTNNATAATNAATDSTSSSSVAAAPPAASSSAASSVASSSVVATGAAAATPAGNGNKGAAATPAATPANTNSNNGKGGNNNGAKGKGARRFAREAY